MSRGFGSGCAANASSTSRPDTRASKSLFRPGQTSSDLSTGWAGSMWQGSSLRGYAAMPPPSIYILTPLRKRAFANSERSG